MKRWWSLFKEAVRGSDRDYTIGPVGPALVMLSDPRDQLVTWLRESGC